jgi:D-lyxose ketol-isomerase
VTLQYSCALEQLDLALAVDDQAQRHRLHAARRLGAGQLAPQHRRQGEADQIIERAAGAVGVDQILVELARASSPRSPPTW